MYALVDCNNFYVSCERVFRPALETRPVIVLSNNDGCAVSRSNEAKDIGIGMAEPYFKLRELIERHNVAVLSSNYPLYGDLSARVMSILQSESPATEIYSIDEAFLDLDIPDPVGFSFRLRKKIKQWTGIPVSIGIARTKTLAKLADQVAKKRSDGVFLLSTPKQETDYLENTACQKLWGVGQRTAVSLAEVGILNGRQLRDVQGDFLRRRFSVVLSRTQMELNGVPAIMNKEANTNHQGIMSSRSFGRKISEFNELRQAVANFVDLATAKLRKRSLRAGVISVSLRTNLHIKKTAQRRDQAEIRLPSPSSDVRLLTQWALVLLKQVYCSSVEYAKASVFLTDLSYASHQQGNLLEHRQQNEGLMLVMDNINQRFGNQSLVTGSILAGNDQWRMSQKMRSPDYTTDWGQILSVH